MAVDIGIQLFSVRNSLGADPTGTLTALMDLGFTRIEGANHQAATDDGIGFGIHADFLTELINERGASVIGCHINPLDLDRLPRVLDFHQQIGNPRIGCDIEFYPYGDVDYVKRRAETFNRIGRLCAERGMEFYYHNHFQEFQRFGDQQVYRLLLEHTDPELVKFELDTFWAYRGGADPLEWLAEFADRYILIHQKDFPADATQPLNLYDGVVDPDAPITMELFEKVALPETFTEVGTGVLPIQDIINAVDKLPNFRFVLLEQDHSTRGELASVKISRDAFLGYDNVNA
ncbi:sugar phosphate isomerase/epimerase family protein [Microlunatus soli]|uniref:Sugar phosphate isomerase/epimerase n=1 Tax=Microlunatus soli TaxID=630515 RepID=A0A1H1NTH9_9ACTN|nr:TIM barrel protein [Microlunatus soli]SDS02286.1 Sugar phosphate isomerase/epimerase [Microlunatus soli]